MVTFGAMRRPTALPVLALAAILAAGCVDLHVTDCPDGVLGKDTPRLRTSRYRVELADRSAAAARFLPYALMSAHAYRDGETCDAKGQQLTGDEAKAFETALQATAPGGWSRVAGFGPKDDCEDERGMMLYVWQRPAGGWPEEVVVAFRGTHGWVDWRYGNLWWFTRFFEDDNQVSRARAAAGRVLAHFKAEARKHGRPEPVFNSTGHSLGGGLAQHVLYAYPNEVRQAIVFHPSSVTGYVAVGAENQVAGCSCDKVAPEGRFMRVYESYEILSVLRIFHKTFFPPERHVQEVRLPLKSGWNMLAGHNMGDFARGLKEWASEGAANPRPAWFDAKGDQCTARLVSGQEKSCKVHITTDKAKYCPQ